MLKQNYRIFKVAQRVLDITILLVITWWLRDSLGPLYFVRNLVLYGTILTAFIFSYFQLYKSWRSYSIFSQLKSLFFSWALVLILLSCIFSFIIADQKLAGMQPFYLFGKAEFVLWSLSVFTGFVALRVGAKLSLHFFRKKGYNQRRAVIVGAGNYGTRIAKHLITNRWMGVRLLGFFDDVLGKGEMVRGSEESLGPVLGLVDDLKGFLSAIKVDICFIALPISAATKINKLVWDLGTNGVNVFSVPDVSIFSFQKAKTIRFGDLTLAHFNLFPAWKRVFDIIFSFVVIVVTAPFWLFIMLAIKFEDRGPIFYKHLRVAENGKRFSCLKFRTMYIKADQKLDKLLEKNDVFKKEWERTFKLKNDPRVTKIGKLLRKTSFDELPQFLNVIAGDMSVVGARPVVSEELEKYYGKAALTYCAMKPGITGPWQVGKRNDTFDYEERVKLDQWYVLNCSFWLDIKIILKTILRILKPVGAY
jgi:undecaprenyl-phosphate glucose phosphotransferase